MSDVVTVDAMPTTALAEQVVGFRIMRETEIAPGWWGQAVEVGETGSGSVAHQFCTEQNAVTMNLNRSKMIQFFVEPVYAETAPAPTTEPLSLTAYAALERLEWAFAPRGALSPEVLRLRMLMRAAHYNPDLPHQVEALACVATIDTARLAAVLTGRAPLDWRIPQQRLAAILSVAAVDR